MIRGECNGIDAWYLIVNFADKSSDEMRAKIGPVAAPVTLGFAKQFPCATSVG